MFKMDRELVLNELTDDKVPTGRSVAFTGVEFLPLQYSDLINQTLG